MGYGQGKIKVMMEEQAGVRTVVLASADADFRQRLRAALTEMRWAVREAAGGAEALAHLEDTAAEALMLDSWLPDLEVEEFAGQMRSRHPGMDLLRTHGRSAENGTRSPRRNELLHALRQAQQDAAGGVAEMPVWAGAPVDVPQLSASARLAPHDERKLAACEMADLLRQRTRPTNAAGPKALYDLQPARTFDAVSAEVPLATAPHPDLDGACGGGTRVARECSLPGVIGASASIRELARLIRLVAPRSTTVLIEGDTGTGKELIASAVHRLSARASKPFVVLNCAAIPESLLEAELFGHTRGAFTGAVQSRTGRVEAANGGTLFLDEIGEMPLALQSKMLRFLECGEIQRVGGNETVRVDVRVVAATHQPLKQRTGEGAFRLDLYHRLAVFPVRVPALVERMEDVGPLAAYLLERLGEQAPVKRLSAAALDRLLAYDWPGNVRELAHVLERATILAEDRPEIAVAEIQP